MNAFFVRTSNGNHTGFQVGTQLNFYCPENLIWDDETIEKSHYVTKIITRLNSVFYMSVNLMIDLFNINTCIQIIGKHFVLFIFYLWQIF